MGTPAPDHNRQDPRQMRVMLLNYEYPPLGGGAGVATAGLAECLAASGADVDVVTSGATRHVSSPVPRLTVHRVRSWRKGIHDAGFGVAPGYLSAALPLARRLLKSFRYDVVHCFFSLPTGALLPLLGLANTPVVLSLRGSDVPGYDPARRSLQAAHRVLRPVTRWLWRRADRVVALSEELGRLARATDPSLRYTVIHNGVDLALFRPPAVSLPPEQRPLRCLAVARLIERKGLADLLRAIALLPPGTACLEVVGSGPEESALRRLSRGLGLDGQVQFTGVLGREQVAQRYRDAQAFTLTPHQESFGNVFAEAMASGLPIVGTRVGGIPEFVTPDRGAFLVPPRDPSSAAAAIAWLAKAHPERARMGAWNRRAAEARLSWQHIVGKYMAVYQEARQNVPPR